MDQLFCRGKQVRADPTRHLNGQFRIEPIHECVIGLDSRIQVSDTRNDELTTTEPGPIHPVDYMQENQETVVNEFLGGLSPAVDDPISPLPPRWPSLHVR